MSNPSHQFRLLPQSLASWLERRRFAKSKKAVMALLARARISRLEINCSLDGNAVEIIENSATTLNGTTFELALPPVLSIFARDFFALCDGLHGREGSGVLMIDVINDKVASNFWASCPDPHEAGAEA
jgi:hypothetical protein